MTSSSSSSILKNRKSHRNETVYYYHEEAAAKDEKSINFLMRQSCYAKVLSFSGSLDGTPVEPPSAYLHDFVMFVIFHVFDLKSLPSHDLVKSPVFLKSASPSQVRESPLQCHVKDEEIKEKILT